MKKKINTRDLKEDDPHIQKDIKNMVSKHGFKKSSNDNRNSKKNKSNEFKKDVKGKSNFKNTNSKRFERRNSVKFNSTKDKLKLKTNDQKGTENKKLLFKPGSWDSEEFVNDPKEFEPVSTVRERELENQAKKIMEEEVETYKLIVSKKKAGNHDWLKTVSSKGTSGDRMAAFIYFVQDSPIHNTAYLNSLITLLNKEKRSLECLETMKDLFLQDLLPKARKMRSFNQNPLSLLESLSGGNKTNMNKRLLFWYFESQLKQTYADFINALEVFSRDTVESLRKKSIGVISALLCEHPEQEKLLLSMLVNKLGDPSPKVSSFNIHLIHKLLLKHKRMNLVVALETERLLYRTNVSRRAQFYAICMLSGLHLQKDESDLACRLLDIFFGFFKLYISKGDIETKMLSAILTGVNKIFPYAKANKDKVLEQTEALYKICHMTKFNTTVQALTLLNQVVDVSDKSSDRYYVLLYKKLLDPDLPSSNKLPLFLNLLCQSMKKDVMEKRVQAFSKRLLQICHNMSPPLVCSALLVLGEVAKENPNVIKLQKTVEEEESDDEHFEDEKDDEDDNKDGDGDDKHDDDDDDNVDADRPKTTGTGSSWVHRNHNNYKLDHYDPFHRNPLYCRADLECTWELINLVNHCHPTISLFAKSLLEGKAIKYSGDPLADFTFKRFLERFIAKNPKKEKDVKKSKDKRDEVDDNNDDAVSINDDEEVIDAMDDDDKDIDFGDFGDVFKDDDDNDSIDDDDDDDADMDFGNVFKDNDDGKEEEEEEDGDDEDDFSEIDELTEDEDGGMAALGVQSEKAMKQMKWEDSQEKKTFGRKRKMTKVSRKGPKAKRTRR